MIRRLRDADAGALTAFLTAHPIETAIAAGLLARYGLAGPVAFHGVGMGVGVADGAAANPARDEMAGLVTMDRGRVLLMGAIPASSHELGALFGGLSLRQVMAMTSVMDALLQARAEWAAAWRHLPQQVEEQMTVQPRGLHEASAPAGVAIRAVVGPEECLALSRALALSVRPAGRAEAWQDQTAEALQRRLSRGSIFAATAAGRLLGLVWANGASREYPRLSRLWLAPESSNSAVGSALAAAAARWLVERGAAHVSCWVPQRDQHLRRVLSKIGFGGGLLWKKVLFAGAG